MPPFGFANTLTASELDACQAARFYRRFAARQVLGNLFREKRVELFLQFGIGFSTAKESVPAHRTPPSGKVFSPITSAMARAICRQRFVSWTSCFLPAAVSR